MGEPIHVGQFPEVVFHIYKGKSFSLDATWWLDDAKTEPADIASAAGKIRDSDRDGAEIVLDLDPTIEDNRVSVDLDGDQTSSIQHRTGFLELEAHATDGQDETLARGRVIFHPEVSE